MKKRKSHWGVNLVSYTSSEKITLYVSSALIIIGLVGSVATSGSLAMFKSTILFFGFAELTLVAIFTLLFLSFVPGLYPRKVRADSIFYSGLGKEPYISDNEVYRPGLPLTHVVVLFAAIIAFFLLQLSNLIVAVPLYINAVNVIAFVLILYYAVSDYFRRRSHIETK